MEARRILVYGVAGSGKTTLASEISKATGIPWHSVDDLTYMPGWISAPLKDQKAIISEICSEDEWILDTAYAKWLDIPLSRAELIVGLDYPRWVSLWRLLKRTVARIVYGKLVCNGNRESMKTVLSRNSIILWHFRSFAKKRRRIHDWIASGMNVIWLRSPAATADWLKEVQRSL